MFTPEQSRQCAAYLGSSEVAGMPLGEALTLRRTMQQATSMTDIPEPHRSRVLRIRGLDTKGGPPDLQAPPLRP